MVEKQRRINQMEKIQLRPGEISGKEDDECRKYQNVQEGEDGLLLHAYYIGGQGYYEPVSYGSRF